MAEVIRLRDRRPRPAAAGDGSGPASLLDRLAHVLAEIVDEPLLTLPNDASYNLRQPLELRLSHFKPELAELAAALLEEADW